MPVESSGGAGGDRQRLTRTGVVVSAAMDKTIVVAVERMVQHSEYKRRVRRTSKYYAHDEKNQCTKGDRVVIVETRPLSKLKRWRLREIVRKASGADLAPESAVDTEDKGRITKKRGKGDHPASEGASS